GERVRPGSVVVGVVGVVVPVRGDLAAFQVHVPVLLGAAGVRGLHLPAPLVVVLQLHRRHRALGGGGPRGVLGGDGRALQRGPHLVGVVLVVLLRAEDLAGGRVDPHAVPVVAAGEHVDLPDGPAVVVPVVQLGGDRGARAVLQRGGDGVGRGHLRGGRPRAVAVGPVVVPVVVAVVVAPVVVAVVRAVVDPGVRLPRRRRIVPRDRQGRRGGSPDQGRGRDDSDHDVALHDDSSRVDVLRVESLGSRCSTTSMSPTE